jgi:hypothetical protein
VAGPLPTRVNGRAFRRPAEQRIHHESNLRAIVEDMLGVNRNAVLSVDNGPSRN